MMNLIMPILWSLMPAFLAGMLAGTLLLWALLRFRNSRSGPERTHPETGDDTAVLRDILALARIGWWELNPRSGGMVWSESLYRMLAYSPGLFTPTREYCMTLIAPEDLPRILEACDRLERCGTPFELYCRMMLADGRWRQFRIAAMAHDGTDGRRTVRGVLQDVTDLSRAQEALSRSVERYRTILDGIDEGYVEVDRHGRVVFFNQAFKTMTRFSTPRLLDAHYRELITTASLPAAREAVRAALLQRRTAIFKGALQVRTGTEIPVEVTLTPIFEARGRLRGFRCLARNIAARLEAEAREREAEHRLWHARKMESLAVIAGGVAHDFNNLLGAIQGYAELLHCEANPTKRDFFMEEIVRLVHRGAGLTAQLTACSGAPLCQIRQAQLIRVLESGVGDALDRKISEDRVQIGVEPDLPPIGCDPDLARRAIANVVANALEASADAEKPVQVRIRRETVSRPVVISCPPGMTLQPNRYQVVEVVDSGPGMMKETMEHVFDPFFSTRFIGRGLGLPAALGIMQAHGGMVELLSEPGRGTTARLWFPEEPSITPVETHRPDTVPSKN